MSYPALQDACASIMLALGHFLWLGTLIAIVMAAIAKRQKTASARYGVWLSGLGVMAASPIITLLLLLTIPSQTDSNKQLVSNAGSSSVSRQDPSASAVTAGDQSIGVPQESERTDHQVELENGSAGSVLSRDLIADQHADVTGSVLQPPPARTTSIPKSMWWREYAPIVMSLYLLGVVLMGLRLLIGLRGGRRLRHEAHLITEVTMLDALQRQADALGMTFFPTLGYCEKVLVPTVLGVLKPMILLPVSLSSGLTMEQIESVLAHELAHLRRCDHVVNLVQRVIESFLFFHPAIWWISRKIRDEREHCCDDLVVACGAVPLDYARSLLRVAELSRVNARDARRQTQGSFTAVSLLATGDRPSTLRQRIARLIGADHDLDVRPASPWFLGSIATVSLLAVWLLMTMTWTVLAEINRDRTQKTVIVTWSAIVDDSVMNEIRALNGLTTLATGSMETPDDGKFSTLRCSADELRTILKNHADNKRLVTLQNNIRHSLPTGGWRIGGEKRFFQMIDSEVIESTDVQNPGHFVNWYADGHETRDEDSDRARLIVDGKFRFTQTGFFSASVAKDVANGVSQWNGNHAESKATAKFDAVMTDGEATLVVLSPPAVTRQYQVLVEDGKRTRFEAKTKQVPQLHAIFVHEAVRVPVKQLDQFHKLTRVDDWVRRGPEETKEHVTRTEEWKARPSRSVSAPDAKWTRDLPNGGHVQLVGLGRPNEARMIWWTPDGEPLSQVSDNLGQSLSGVELAAIVRVWEDGVSRKLPPPKGMNFAGGVMDVPDTFPSPGSQLLTFPAMLDKATGKVSLKIGAGFGGWSPEVQIAAADESKATLNDIEVTKQSSHEHHAFGPAGPPKFIQMIGTWFRFQPYCKFEFDAIAVSRDGTRFASTVDPTVLDNARGQSAQHFTHPLSKADLKHFLIKSRPVHWTEFTDFATEPAVALVPPLEFEGNRQGPRVGKHFAKLTDGIAVQLLGVGDLETPKANWWKGDGQRLETAPVDRLPAGTGGTPEMRSRMRNFVYRVSGLSQGQAVKCYSSESPDHAPWEMLHVGNMRDDGLVTNLVVPFSRLSPTDLCISVTQQEWWAPLSITPSLQMTQREEADPLAKTLYGLVRVIGVSEEPGIPPAIAEEIDRGLTYPPQATLTVEWDLSLTRDLAQMEMTAVEKSGTRHQLHAWGKQRRTNDKTIEQPHFSCRLSDVDHFEIRLRPILHRVKFENVSLKRDENTDVKVTVASLPAAKPQDYVANFPDGASVELLAIESEQTTEKPKRWRPDGGLFSDKVEWPERVRFPNEASHDLLIRFQGLQKGQLVVWRLKGLVLGPNRPEDESGSVRVRFNNTGDATELRVGLTETEWGPWQKVDVSGKLIDPVEVPPAHRDSYRQVQPDHVTPLTGHTRLDWRNVPAISDQAVTHVVAIDKQGKRHEPSAVTLWGDQNPQHADVFKLAVEDIDHFEYQHLPLRHWARWKNISLRAGHRTKVEVEKNSIRSTAILPGGISVEFVGLAEMGKEDKTWWKPDGDVLIPSPKLAPQHRGTWKIGAEELRRTLFHVRGLNDSRALSSNMSGSIDEEQLPSGEKLHSWSGALQKRPDQKTAVARIGVATEPISPTRILEANGQRRPKPANAPIDHIAEDITVTKVKSLEGGHKEVAGKFVPITQAELSFETPMAWRQVDLRIVAIDKEGKTHHQSGAGGNLLADANSKTPGTATGMVLFPLPPEQIDRFEYQFRLYRHWVTFENVAWQSGETTKLKITNDSLPSSKPQQYVASLPDGRSVELVGITKNTTPAKDGWKPDGTSIGDVGYWPATIVLHSNQPGSYSSSSFDENGPHPEPDAEAIDVLFRFQGLKEQPSITFDMATNGTSYSHLPLKHPYDLRISTRRRGDPHPGSQWGIPDGEVRVGLTDEPWGKWLQISPEGKVLNPLTDEDLHLSSYEKVQIVGVAPHERATNKQALVLRQPQDASRLYSFEIRGVDEDGKAQWVLEWDGRGIEGTEIKEGRWGLANNEKKPLARYEFRLRPYRYWAKFKGVSFHPGKTSDVKVSVETVASPDKKTESALQSPILEFRLAAQLPGSKLQPRVPEGYEKLSYPENTAASRSLAKDKGFVWVKLANSIDGRIELPITDVIKTEQRNVLLSDTPEHVMVWDGKWRVEECRVVDDRSNGSHFIIEVKLDEAGGEAMKKLTASHLNQSLAIVVNNEVVAVPIIRSEIGRNIAITGNFTREQADKLAASLTPKAASKGLGEKSSSISPLRFERELEKTVVGTVVAPNGRPVDGIDVMAFQGEKQLEQTFTTDVRGMIRVPKEWRETEHWLTLVARDGKDRLGWFDFMVHGHSDIGQKTEDGSFKLVLLPVNRTVRGRIVDESGMPLAQVPVRIRQLEHDVNQMAVHWRYQSLGGKPLLPGSVTDNDGRFEMKVPTESTVWLGTNHPDWVEKIIIFQKENDDAGETKLIRAAKVSGRVTDARSGTPLAGVVIAARASQTEIGESSGDEATSDADGNYIIHGLRSGAYTIQVARSPFKALTVTALPSVELKAGETHQADFALNVGQRLAGRVLHLDTGDPIAKCKVYCTNPARPNGDLSTETNEQGEFEFVVPPGKSKVSAAEGRLFGNASFREVDIDVAMEGEVAPITLKVGDQVESVPGSFKIFLGPPLERKVSLKFNETPLNDALQFLCDSAGMTLEIDDLVLTNAGYSKEASVTVMEESPMTLKDALNRILKPFDKLTYQVSKNRIVVRTADEKDSNKTP